MRRAVQKTDTANARPWTVPRGWNPKICFGILGVSAWSFPSFPHVDRSSSGGGLAGGSSARPPAAPTGSGSERCCVCAPCRERSGSSTRWNASTSSNPNPWCRATETWSVDKTGPLASGERYFSAHVSLLSVERGLNFPVFLVWDAVSSHVWRRRSLTYGYVRCVGQENLRSVDETSIQITLRPSELSELGSPEATRASSQIPPRLPAQEPSPSAASPIHPSSPEHRNSSSSDGCEDNNRSKRSIDLQNHDV